jgi:hypothetical protein
MRYWIPVILTLCCVGQSCQKDHPDKTTYIAYSLNGASYNGAFRIEPDKDMSTLDATAVFIPETADNPEAFILTFYDYTNQREVVFTMPAKEAGSAPFLLLHDSVFGMGIIMDGGLLTSGGRTHGEWSFRRDHEIQSRKRFSGYKPGRIYGRILRRDHELQERNG